MVDTKVDDGDDVSLPLVVCNLDQCKTVVKITHVTILRNYNKTLKMCRVCGGSIGFNVNWGEPASGLGYSQTYRPNTLKDMKLHSEMHWNEIPIAHAYMKTQPKQFQNEVLTRNKITMTQATKLVIDFTTYIDGTLCHCYKNCVRNGWMKFSEELLVTTFVQLATLCDQKQIMIRYLKLKRRRKMTILKK